MPKYLLRAATIGFAAVVLTSGATSMAASADEMDDVDVTVEIPPVSEPGTLALSVDARSTALTESESADGIREFVGTLPDVTVTDTRTMAERPEGSSWYVLGTARDFESEAGETIAANHFGWSPHLVSGTDEGDGIVSVGGDVETVLDGDRGLVDQELLFLGEDLPVPDSGGRWTADADLFLRVPVDVAPGTYSSTVTLSLFE